MTSRTTARIAGYTFLLYIVAGIASLMVFGHASAGDGIAAKLASIAQHAAEVRIVVVLNVLMSLSALVLGVTLYGLTRHVDHEVAMLGMACRVVEGVNGASSIPQTLGLLWLATATGANAPAPAAANVLGGYLLKSDAAVSATFFAVGSLLFSWLLLRGRTIPVWLARLGVVASALLVVGLPMQLGGLLRGVVAQAIWAPMLVFEVALALLLIIRGVAPPVPAR